MNERFGLWPRALVAVAALSVAPLRANGIPFVYPDMSGTTVVYTGISEESVTDPSVALFGAPAIAGDELFFSPTVFSVVSTSGVAEQRTGALSLTVEAQPLQGIHDLELRESGTYTLLGSSPDFAQALVGGAVLGEVIEVDGGPVAAGLDLQFEVQLDVSGASGVFTLGPSSEVETPWSALARVDIDALLVDRGTSGTATRVQFSIANNTLGAFSAAGTEARIAKTGVKVLANVPEPSFLGMVTGLVTVFLLGVRWRRSRRRLGPQS